MRNADACLARRVMSSTFFSSCDSCRWKAVLKQYERVLETKAEKSRKRQEMVYLDNW